MVGFRKSCCCKCVSFLSIPPIPNLNLPNGNRLRCQIHLKKRPELFAKERKQDGIRAKRNIHDSKIQVMSPSLLLPFQGEEKKKTPSLCQRCRGQNLISLLFPDILYLKIQIRFINVPGGLKSLDVRVFALVFVKDRRVAATENLAQPRGVR